MRAHYAEEYVTVTVLLLETREKSLRVDAENIPAPVWLPRGALDFTDARLLDRKPIGQPVALKIKGELAQQKGLV